MTPRRRRLALLLALGSLMGGPATAGIRIEIEGLEGEARRNVLAFLSVERYRERAELTEDTVTRLFNRIDGEVRSALRPLGYYEPEVRTDLLPNEGGDWQVRIAVQAGEPVLIRSVEIAVEGAGSEDAVFGTVTTPADLREGRQLNHGTYERAKGDLARTAATYGYLDARLTTSELRVDPATHAADIVLRIETGERYRFGAVDIEQSVVRQELMRRFLRFREGEPYDASQLLRTQFALDDSLYFSTVEVTPGERDAQTLTVPIRITAQKSRRQFTLGAGYGTDTNVRGTFGWTDSRLNDRGHRLRVEVRASSITRRVDARYDIPVGDPALERVSLDVLNRRELRGDLTTIELTGRPSLTQVRGRWQRVLSVGVTTTDTDAGGAIQRTNLVVPGIAYASVPDGFLGETLFTRGLYVEMFGSHSALGGDSDFLRLHVQSERVFDFADRWHLLLRGEAGASLVRNFEELPGIYRFFAGGDRSVRGFAFNALSPRTDVLQRTTGEVITKNTGGRHLLVGTVEVARDLPRNLAAATFFDIGNAFNRFGDPLEYSAGIGLRFRLPAVTLGVDIAQPLSTSAGPRLHLNISPQL
jgi:translocation and assembly module TamA